MTRIGNAIRMLFTLRCDESHRLLSARFERELSIVERWAIRLHFLACRPCRKVGGKLHRLHELALDRGSEPAKLPQSARQRIRANLIQEIESDSSHA